MPSATDVRVWPAEGFLLRAALTHAAGRGSAGACGEAGRGDDRGQACGVIEISLGLMSELNPMKVRQRWVLTDNLLWLDYGAGRVRAAVLFGYGRMDGADA